MPGAAPRCGSWHFRLALGNNFAGDGRRKQPLKATAEFVTEYLSSIVKMLAAMVIAVALIQFIIRYARYLLRPPDNNNTQTIRIKFGSSLALALELLLGADILATAVAPTWDDIGKLVAIATLRTALNYFLERELKNSGISEKGKV
jgi:uncharacterized membrane protein